MRTVSSNENSISFENEIQHADASQVASFRLYVLCVRLVDGVRPSIRVRHVRHPVHPVPTVVHFIYVFIYFFLPTYKP